MDTKKMLKLYQSLNALGTISPDQVPEDLVRSTLDDSLFLKNTPENARQAIAACSELAQSDYSQFETAVNARDFAYPVQLSEKGMEALHGGRDISRSCCGHTWEGGCTSA